MVLSAHSTISPLHYSHQPGQQSRWLTELADLIAFLTISALPKHRRDIKAAVQWLIRHLAKTVCSHFKITGGSRPVLLPRKHPVMLAAARSVEQTGGVPPVFTRSGGSIPLIEQLNRRLRVTVVLFSLPDDDIHAPNEKMRLPNFFCSVEIVIRLLAEYAEMGVGPLAARLYTGVGR